MKNGYFFFKIKKETAAFFCVSEENCWFFEVFELQMSVSFQEIKKKLWVWTKIDVNSPWILDELEIFWHLSIWVNNSPFMEYQNMGI